MKKMKKFELTEEKIIYHGRKLFRIRALIDFDIVKKGELGGFVEKEENLSHNGNAWVGNNAFVYDDACVFGNAFVDGCAEIYGKSLIYGNSKVDGNAIVCGNVSISDNACVFGNAFVDGCAYIWGKIKLKTRLCSRFSFKFDWQVKLWQKKEKEFEDYIKKKRKRIKTI